ncbi:hypothetical protein HA402_005217 [Bradysia odoriphaga]|nr:hypothetical protein HA402_005217 [Bradysia odoriphaga]
MIELDIQPASEEFRRDVHPFIDIHLEVLRSDEFHHGEEDHGTRCHTGVHRFKEFRREVHHLIDIHREVHPLDEFHHGADPAREEHSTGIHTGVNRFKEFRREVHRLIDIHLEVHPLDEFHHGADPAREEHSTGIHTGVHRFKEFRRDVHPGQAHWEGTTVLHAVLQVRVIFASTNRKDVKFAMTMCLERRGVCGCL